MSGDEVFDPDVFAALAGVLPPLPAPDGGRERLIAAATGGALRFAPFVPALGALFDLAADAVEAVLARAAQAASWVPGPLPGVELLHFDGGPLTAGADCGLVRLAPGTVFPDHGHAGDEAVLILQGGYEDSSGRTYHPGELHRMGPGSRHGYVVLRDEPCAVAVMLHGGIEIDGHVVPVKG